MPEESEEMEKRAVVDSEKEKKAHDEAAAKEPPKKYPGYAGPPSKEKHLAEHQKKEK